MTTADLLTDAFGRIREVVHDAVDGLSPDQLSLRPAAQANSIAWLIWHLTRITDDHVADAAGTGQAWTAGGWAARFGLPFDVAETGYGHDSSQVEAVRVREGGRVVWLAPRPPGAVVLKHGVRAGQIHAEQETRWPAA